MPITISEAIVFMVRQAGRADGSFTLNESSDAVDQTDLLQHMKNAKSTAIDSKILSGELNEESALAILLNMPEDQRREVVSYCRIVIESDKTKTDSESGFLSEISVKLGV
jgi:hypothetical protein